MSIAKSPNIHPLLLRNELFTFYILFQPELWNCVGEDRRWDLVFVDCRPKEMRGPNALRLVRRSKLVVAHDGNADFPIWPADWLKTRLILTQFDYLLFTKPHSF